MRFTRADESQMDLTTVPYFVPHLGRKPSQMVAEGQSTEKPLQAWKIKAVAINPTQCQLSLDGLLISGLEVQVLPGSPLFVEISEVYV